MPHAELREHGPHQERAPYCEMFCELNSAVIPEQAFHEGLKLAHKEAKQSRSLELFQLGFDEALGGPGLPRGTGCLHAALGPAVCLAIAVKNCIYELRTGFREELGCSREATGARGCRRRQRGCEEPGWEPAGCSSTGYWFVLGVGTPGAQDALRLLQLQREKHTPTPNAH